MPTAPQFSVIVSRLSVGFWLLFFVTLPLAKGLNSVAEIGLLILGLAKADFTGFRQNLRQYAHVAAITLVFVALLLGMLYTDNLQQGFKLLRHSHRFAVVPLAFLLHASWVKQHVALLLKTFCIGVAIGCAATVLLYLLPEPTARGIAHSFPILMPYPDLHNRLAFGLYSPFIERIQFSSLIGLGILCCLYLLKEPERLLPLILLPLLAYTMLILGGRGGQLALLAALLLPLGFWLARLTARRISGRFARVTISVAAVVVALGLLVLVPYAAYKTNHAVRARIDQSLWELEVWQTGNYTPEAFAHFTSVRRLVSWQNLWRIIQEQPLLGTGTGDFASALTQAYATDSYALIENIHSQYLFFWAMLGLWGVLLFLGVLLFWGAKMAGTKWHNIIALSVLVFYAVNMIPDAVLYMQIDQMAFCAFLSLFGLMKGMKDISESRISRI